MVGAGFVVGSSLVDPKTFPPCLCLDALPSLGLNSQRHSVSMKYVPSRIGSLQLNSSFLDHSSLKALSGAKSLRKHWKSRSLVVVDELSGQYEDNFEDVNKQLLDYFTYKALRTVLNQLYEMNPTQYRWLHNHLASNKHGYGKVFLSILGKERHDIAERVMVTRLHLYGKWIKKCDHAEIYERIANQNLELMRERLMQTVVWPSDDEQ